MSKTYEQKAQDVEAQLSDVDLALEGHPDHQGLQATKASLLRSLRWYRTRSRTTPVQALGIGVADVVLSGDVSG